jgi:hypothetical protein
MIGPRHFSFGQRSHFLDWLRAAFLASFLVPALVGGRALAQSAPETESPNSPTAQENTAPNKAPVMPAVLLARKSVEKYFAQATNVVCIESVSQAIVGKNGKPAYREESVFDYQLQTNANSGSLKLVESRDMRKASFRDAARTLLITDGFASMLLIVHLDYETSYIFEPDGEETNDDTTLARINFKPIPGASSPAALRLRGQNYPIPLSGTLWIDSRTGAITKLVASVDSSLSDLGLKGMRSEIHYAMIQFHDPEEAYWMPVSATIDVETPRQHWRNVHRFSSYKRFRATMEIEAAIKR